MSEIESTSNHKDRMICARLGNSGYVLPLICTRNDGFGYMSGGCCVSSLWLCAATIDADVHVKGQEDACKANEVFIGLTECQSGRSEGSHNSYGDFWRRPKVEGRRLIKTAVGGAADVIHAVDCATTDCQPNENVEALRVFMLGKKVECRPVWKPMHKHAGICSE